MKNTILKRLHEIELEILDEIVRICECNNIQYFLIGGTLLGAIRHKGFIPWDDDLDIAMPRADYDRFLEICKSELNEKYIVDHYETNKEYWLPFAKIRKKGTIYEQAILSNNPKALKGIWVDIFPLDNAKYQDSIMQKLQAAIVKLLRRNIGVQHKYYRVNSWKGKIIFSLMRMFSIRTSFNLQHKVMTWWNDKDTDYFVNLGSQYGHKKQTIRKDKYFPATKVEFEGGLYYAPNDWDYILTRIYGDYMKLPPEDKRVSHNPIRVDFGDEEDKIPNETKIEGK